MSRGTAAAFFMSIQQLSNLHARQLLNQPGAVPWHINGAKSQVWYRVLSEQVLYQTAFLDQRLALVKDESLFAASLTLLDEYQQQLVRPVNWIFHTSFCCSTLLARLLQVQNQVLAIKEPIVLNQLADAFRQQPENSKQFIRLFAQITGQLNKQFRSDQMIILKTSNYMNALLNQTHRINNSSRILLVVGGIRSFARSMLKNREEATKTVPVFLRALMHDISIKTDYLPGTDFKQDIAYMWAVQIILFSEFVQNSKLSVAMVKKQDIISNTRAVVSACDQFFGIDSKRTSEEISSIMQRDSKQQDNSPSVIANGSIDKREQAMLAAVEELALELIPDNALQTLEAKRLQL